MRDAYERHVAALASDTHRLVHRFAGPYALEHAVGAESTSHLEYFLDAFLAALDNDVSCSEVPCQLLPRGMAAHHDDPVGAHLSCRQCSEQSDGAVANH